MPDITPAAGPGPDGCRCGLPACRSGWPAAGAGVRPPDPPARRITVTGGDYAGRPGRGPEEA